jgi:hypothetical protein
MYTTKIKLPIYEPSEKKPDLVSLSDDKKVVSLVNEIQSSGLPTDEKRFLIDAAQRHRVFNYRKIADYYSHSGPEMRRLMEKSALVIIDLNAAIENGYVRLTRELVELRQQSEGLKNAA